MTDSDIKKCPECGQNLRFPDNVGGIVLKCPSCGHRFQSDFKIGHVGKRTSKNGFVYIFEMPSRILERIGRYFS